MAFDYARYHVRYFYNNRGQSMPAYNIDDEARAKEQGFTSATYVPSKWPTTVYNKKTGETKAVGKLDWDEKRNQAAVMELGLDWTTEHVAPPEQPPTKASGEGIGAPLAMLEILGELRRIHEELAELTSAVAELGTARVATESRLGALEHELGTDAPAEAPSTTRSKKDKHSA